MAKVQKVYTREFQEEQAADINQSFRRKIAAGNLSWSEYTRNVVS